MVCDSPIERIGNLRKKPGAQSKVTVRQLVVVDRSVQIQCMISHISDRDDEPIAALRLFSIVTLPGAGNVVARYYNRMN